MKNGQTAEEVKSDRTESILQKLGYKENLYRGLNGFMAFAIGYTEVGALVSLTSLFTYGFKTGGPVAMSWGWMISTIMTTIVAYCLAEICSAYPAAGSVYLWAGQLAPRKWSPWASYWTGITNWLGNAGGDASFAFCFASSMSSALGISGYSFLTVEEQVFASIAVLLLWSLLNFVRIDQVGWLNNLGAFVQIGTTYMIVATVLLMAPKLNSNEFVFTKFYNTTGFDNVPYVSLISLLFSLFAFSGYEASSHVAEETHGSEINAPMGMIYTVLAAGVGGMLYIMAMLYAVQDVDGAINSDRGSAAIEIFLQTSDVPHAALLCWLVVANAFFAGLSSVGVTSRITYALVRDKATPYHEFFSQIHPVLNSPVNATSFVFFFVAILLLLPLTPSGACAFFSLTGICTIGFQVSYGIPIFLKLFYMDPDMFPQTPMSLGQWSNAMGLLAVIWLWGTSIVFFLPTTYPFTYDTMNYTVVVVSLVMLAGWLNWVFLSRHTFEGPRRPDDALYGRRSYIQVSAASDEDSGAGQYHVDDGGMADTVNDSTLVVQRQHEQYKEQQMIEKYPLLGRTDTDGIQVAAQNRGRYS